MSLYVGDVTDFAAQLAPASVQTIVTSPPYWGLRFYLPADHPRKGQEIGIERTPEEYIGRLVAVFAALRPALKPDGTLWVNLGDAFAGGGNGTRDPERWPKQSRNAGGIAIHAKKGSGLKDKDLIGLPWMLAFALRADGWYLRSDIVWAKKNCMPESITDRPTRAHEFIFLLSKSARYFYDKTAIDEPARHAGKVVTLGEKSLSRGQTNGAGIEASGNGNAESVIVATSRNKRDVWHVATQPYPEAHYATFPPELIRPCILAGTSAKGECARCGKAWVRVVESDNPSKDANVGIDMSGGAAPTANPQTSAGMHRNGGGVYSSRVAIGWEPQCSCGAPVVPQTVCDPFLGSGTTAAVAVEEGRRWVGCDIDERNAGLVAGRTDGRQVRMQIGGLT